VGAPDDLDPRVARKHLRNGHAVVRGIVNNQCLDLFHLKGSRIKIQTLNFKSRRALEL
jgi:hypothetical protein